MYIGYYLVCVKDNYKLFFLKKNRFNNSSTRLLKLSLKKKLFQDVNILIISKFVPRAIVCAYYFIGLFTTHKSNNLKHLIMKYIIIN